MEKKYFIAKFENENGIPGSYFFNSETYDKEKAAKFLQNRQIKNFFFFFEPIAPTPFGDNGMMFKGEIGFDITTENLIPEIIAGKDIYIDSPGGNLFEGWKIYDAIKLSGKEPRIVGLGTVASAATLPFLATVNNELTENSRFLIHNPSTFEAGDDGAMFKTAEILKDEKIKLANLYSNVSGQPVETILSLMKDEKFLNYTEALNLKFTKMKPIKETITDPVNIDDQKKEVNGILTGLKNLFKKFTNVITNLIVQDVNGSEIDFGDQIETADQITLGLSATVNGSPADGEYTLPNGTIYIFGNGILTEIKLNENDQNAALLEENTNLQTENFKLKNEIESVKAAFEVEIKAVKDQFDTFKNRFSNNQPDPIMPVDPVDTEIDFKFNRKKK